MTIFFVLKSLSNCVKNYAIYGPTPLKNYTMIKYLSNCSMHQVQGWINEAWCIYILYDRINCFDLRIFCHTKPYGTLHLSIFISISISGSISSLYVFACSCNLHNLRDNPGFNVTNVLRTHFLYKRLFGSFYMLHISRKRWQKDFCT